MKVVVTDYTFESMAQERQMCERNGYSLEIEQCRNAQEVLQSAHDADAILTNFAPIPDEVLAGLKNCKVIVRYGVGTDNVDLEAAKRHGIPVCNVPDYGVDEVADHASALTLSLVRQLPIFDRSIRSGNWPAIGRSPILSCKEMMFAVVGAGQIGRATLERMKVFGFRLGAYDPFVDAQRLTSTGAEVLSLDEVFETADVVSLHLPLTGETHHLVDSSRLRTMKKTAILINTSRGALVDTVAMAEALQTGEIAYAGLDVFESEPMEPDHPLRQCDNALFSSHIAYYSKHSMLRLQQFAAEEVERALKGETLRCRVA